jgi:hypothetical protein
MASKQPRSQADPASRNQQINTSTQSTISLSQPSDDQTDDGRFSVAEEVNLDQQSDKARHVGQMSLDWGEVEGDQISAADAASKPKQKNKENTRKEKLKQSINRAVPPSQ